MPTLRSLLRRFVYCLFLCSILAASVAAQVQKPSPTPESPKSIVKGRVLYDDTNDPVRRSRLLLIQLTDDRGNLSSATDREGRFEIREVPPGVYFVLIDSPGIISPVAFVKFVDDNRRPESFDVKSLRDYCTEIAVDGTNNLNVTVRAKRGGAISGKVTYSDGVPAVNAVLSVYKRTGKERTRIIPGTSMAGISMLHTDDRGRYRISGLPPGDYFVSVAEKNTSATRSRGGIDSLTDLASDALTSSYYGNSGKLSGALAIEVGLGSEINDIDIVLSDTTPHMISGTIVAKSDGRPLPAATITIRNKEQSDWLSRDPQRISSGLDGTWIFDEVPDGTYAIAVDPPYEPDSTVTPSTDETGDAKPAPKKRKVLPKQIEVMVAGSDVVGLSVELIEGASISGTVQSPDIEPERGYIAVRYAYVGEGSAESRVNPAAVSQDGKFTIEPLKAGKLYLTADASIYSGPGEKIKYYVKSITLNGTDLMKNLLTIESGQTITNVRIVLAADTADAKIQLLDGAGKPVPARALAIVPMDQSKWSFDNQRSLGVTNAAGIVPFSGAPGDYLVIVAGKDDPWPPTLDATRAAVETAAHVKLGPGDNKILPVTVK